MRAQSIKGLSISIEQREFNSTGGMKDIPSGVNFTNLVLNRAVLEKAESIGVNTMEVFSELRVKRIDLGIHLLDAMGKYSRSWNVIGAYLIKWNMADLDAKSNEVLVETLEFKYKYLREIK